MKRLAIPGTLSLQERFAFDHNKILLGELHTTLLQTTHLSKPVLSLFTGVLLARELLRLQELTPLLTRLTRLLLALTACLRLDVIEQLVLYVKSPNQRTAVMAHPCPCSASGLVHRPPPGGARWLARSRLAQTTGWKSRDAQHSSSTQCMAMLPDLHHLVSSIHLPAIHNLLTLAYERVVYPCSTMNCGDVVHRR